MAVSKYHADYMVTWENQVKKDTDDMANVLVSRLAMASLNWPVPRRSITLNLLTSTRSRNRGWKLSSNP
jgi:hypothetical protein